MPEHRAGGAGSRPKLSNEQAQAAKELTEGGNSVSVVARTFNVSRPTIYRAIERMDTQTQR
ncbi:MULTISPECIES: helix-turn-helix domain-containing protein [unclassified Corynebacterium]|uniref:helix-turn-helix domain-containing protein n=1 Tax=unclassified Corynebacterium TaxID=2624378 RepID=UPI0009F6AA9D|nr:MULTISPECIES: helix-turn-helix domain-containing protein [unclassified Corynebacterium]MDK8790519.1 helix-turn-helix domain-containing protein [Corynebacterium sp. MSK039]